MRKFVLAVGLLMLIAPAMALAEGCVYKEDTGLGPELPYQDIRIPGDFTTKFDPEVPDQTVVYESTGRGYNNWGVISCPRSPNGREIHRLSYDGLGIYDRGTKTYPTSVDGIGYRLSIRTGGSYTEWPFIYDYDTGVGRLVPGASDYRIQLVKIGPITAKGQLSGEIAHVTLLDHGMQVMVRVRFESPLVIEPRVPTCAPTAAVPPVPLGSIFPQQLDAPSGGSPAVTFKIKLNCAGGSTGAKTRMYLALTDVASPANRGSYLTLTPGPNTAKGVAVEIRRNNGASVVNFGPDSKTPGSAGQWYVGQFGSNEGTEVELTARYVKTGAAFKPGQADAAATFTISYR